MKFILTTTDPFVLVFDWLSCIKWEYISGSQSKCTPQPRCGSVSRQDFDALPSSLSQTSASPQSQHPGTRPCEAFQHPPASAPSTVNLRFNYLRTKFSKLQRPSEDFCSNTVCSHVAKGAEVVLTIWKGARGAGEPIQFPASQEVTRGGKNQTMRRG